MNCALKVPIEEVCTNRATRAKRLRESQDRVTAQFNVHRKDAGESRKEGRNRFRAGKVERGSGVHFQNELARTVERPWIFISAHGLRATMGAEPQVLG